ncbi:MAG: STAS domain-containing protein [Betaproteobacteria bacterium]
MLVLPAELTNMQATALLTRLGEQFAAQNGTELTVDASAMERFDSSALALLLQLRRDALERGKTFSVKGLPQRLRELAALYGVAQLLTASC